jgi:hypothetical protein
MDAIWVALIVAVGSTLSPLLVAYLTNRHRKAERLQDYARQDAVAARAATVARSLLEQQEATAAQATETARRLLEANQQVADAAKTANGKLDVIHTLVNSNMTAAMQSELDATTRELAMMNEVVALKKAAGHEPTPETLAALEATQQRVTELRSSLEERLEQTELAERQIAEGEARRPTHGATGGADTHGDT